MRIAYCAREERGALRMLIRALRKVPLDTATPWEATVWLGDEGIATPRINRELAKRVRFVRPEEVSAEAVIAAADVLCVTSGGPRPAPGLIQHAFSSGTIPVAAQIEPYSELLEEDETGFMFPPGDVLTLAGQLQRLLKSAELRTELAAAAAARTRSFSQVADELELIYRQLCDRRHDPAGKPAVRKRIASRPTIDCDLHMHTDHSNDCATPVEVLLETAKDRGMGAIAVTDHNEISGALAAREAAERDGGIKVIVGEEVKTAEQGEVIGLFLETKIERGMTMRETIDEIRRQGGLVYVPHPFDRLHSVPDYQHLLDIVEEIDILEVFNPRVAFSAFNEEAERFAAKYRIVPGAGSDGHVAQALGSVRIRLHDFDGPEEFLEAMRSADIVRKHKNLVYVQALKWMQAASGQAGGRKQVSDPKPVQGGRRQEAKRARSPRRGDARPAARVDSRGDNAVQPTGDEEQPSKLSHAVPTTEDQIKEKYLERAIRELNQLTHRLQDCEDCPRGQPDAGARLGPSAGRRDAAQVRADAGRDRGGRRLLRPLRQRGAEEPQAAQRRSAQRLRHALRQVPARRSRAGRARVRRPRRRGGRDRRAALHRRDGRGGARLPQRPADPAGANGRAAARGRSRR